MILARKEVTTMTIEMEPTISADIIDQRHKIFRTIVINRESSLSGQVWLYA